MLLIYAKGNTREYLRGKYHCTVHLLFDWFGICCMTTNNFCFYLQNRLIQTSQTGGQRFSDTSPFSIPCVSNLQVKQLKGNKLAVVFQPERQPQVSTPLDIPH
jgi:hypothetical protein